MEKKSEGKISFLDVQIERKEGKLSTGVYRKNTHIDRYINYASHHHLKTGVIACPRNRAEKVSDQQSLKSELSRLKKTFEPNTKQQKNQNQKVIYLPYVQQTSEHIHTYSEFADR